LLIVIFFSDVRGNLMPELPDVENFRRFLNGTANHHTIERVEIRDTMILRGASSRSFQTHVSGKKITRTLRHGKHLFAALESGFVAFHFGMTGYLQSFVRQEFEPEYNRVIFHLNNGIRVAFCPKEQRARS
jgi:formamidopyrimidine-DNA glycosylase